MSATKDRPHVVTIQMLKAARRSGHAWEDMRAMMLDGRMVVTGFGAYEESLVKGAGHKYVMRVPTGDPRHPWRYVYEDDLRQLQLDVEETEPKPKQRRSEAEDPPHRRRPPRERQSDLFPDTNLQQELPEGAEEPPPSVVENLATAPDPLYDVVPMTHTRTGETVWHARTDEYLDRDVWIAKARLAKQNGGYYWRKGKAFVFKTKAAALAFQSAAGSRVPAATNDDETDEQRRDRAMDEAGLQPHEKEGLELLERGDVEADRVPGDRINGVTAAVKRGWAALRDGVYSLLGGGRDALATYREVAGEDPPDLSTPPEYDIDPPAPEPTTGRASDGEIRYGDVRPGDVLVDAPPGPDRGEESVVAVKDEGGDVEVWLRAGDGSTRFIRRGPDSTVGVREVEPGWDRMPDAERVESWAAALREGTEPQGSVSALLDAVKALDDLDALVALYEAMKGHLRARKAAGAPAAPSGRGGGPGGLSMRDVLAMLEAKLAQLGFDFGEPAPPPPVEQTQVAPSPVDAAEAARLLTDADEARASWSMAEELLSELDEALKAHDTEHVNNGKRFSRKKATDALLKLQTDFMARRPPPRVIRVGGLRVETVGSAVEQHAFEAVEDAFEWRLRTLRESEPSLIRDSGFWRGLSVTRSRLGAGRMAMLRPGASEGLADLETASEALRLQLADAAALPQSHHDLLEKHQTYVRPLLGPVVDVGFSVLGSASTDRRRRQRIILTDNIVTNREDYESGITLVHEIGHVLDHIVSEGRFDKAGQRREEIATHEARLVELASGGASGHISEYADESTAMWQRNRAEWVAEAYRYAFRDGDELKTTLQAADFDAAEWRRAVDDFVAAVDRHLDNDPEPLDVTEIGPAVEVETEIADHTFEPTPTGRKAAELALKDRLRRSVMADDRLRALAGGGDIGSYRHAFTAEVRSRFLNLLRDEYMEGEARRAWLDVDEDDEWYVELSEDLRDDVLESSVDMPAAGDVIEVTDGAHLPSQVLVGLLDAGIALKNDARGKWRIYNVDGDVYRMQRLGGKRFLNLSTEHLRLLLAADFARVATEPAATPAELGERVRAVLQDDPKIRQAAQVNSFDNFRIAFDAAWRTAVADLVDELGDAPGEHDAWAELYQDQGHLDAAAHAVYDAVHVPEPEPRLSDKERKRIMRRAAWVVQATGDGMREYQDTAGGVIRIEGGTLTTPTETVEGLTFQEARDRAYEYMRDNPRPISNVPEWRAAGAAVQWDHAGPSGWSTRFGVVEGYSRDAKGRAVALVRDGGKVVQIDPSKLSAEPGNGDAIPVEVVAYHGTDAQFTEFDPEKKGTTTDAGLLGAGFYFSTDPQVARKNKRTVRAAVRLERPLTVAYPSWGSDKAQLVSDAIGLPSRLEGEELTQALRDAGYDGVVLDYSPVGYAHQEIAAFDVEQITMDGDEPGPQEEADDEPLATPPTPGLDYTGGFTETLRQVRPWGASAGLKPSERKAANARALEIVAGAAGRELTPEERAEVARYSGEGGEGVGTSMNQYYTRPEVAAAMWERLRELGLPADARVLEPACGSGVFIETAPAGTRLTGVEIDDKAAGVATALHPGHEVVHAPFEDVATTDPGGYDAVITNAPFGVRQDGTRALHKRDVGTADQYFIDTSLDKVKDGGLVAVIVNKGVMSSVNGRRFRERMQARAEVVGAYRLPQQAFGHSHTSVTSDVIILRKRPEVVGQALAAAGEDLMRRVGTWDEAFAAGNWYSAHPEHVLGTVEQGFRGEYVDGTEEGLAERIVAGELPGGTQTPSIEAVLAAAADDPVLERAARRGAGVDPAADVKPVGTRRRVGDRTEILTGDPPRWVDVDTADIEGGEKETEDPAVTSASNLADRVANLLALVEAGEVYAARRQRREVVPEIRQWIEDHGVPKEHKALLDRAKKDARLYHLLAAVDDDGNLSDILTRQQIADVRGDVDAGDVGAVAEHVAARNDGWVDLADVANAWTGGDAGAVREALLALDVYAVEDGRVRHLEDYLTGNLYAKLDALEELIADATGTERAKLEWQRGRLTAALDEQSRSLDDVELDLRAGWVPPDVIGAWLTEEAAANKYDDETSVEVRYEDGVYLMRTSASKAAAERRAAGHAATGHTGDEDGWFAAPSSTYGVRGRVLAFLNRLPIRDRGGKEAAEERSQEFGTWLRQSEHRDRVEDVYNRTFNAVRRKTHSTAALEIDTGEITLDGYQNQTVRALAEARKGILAHDVGLGKTFQALALAKLRRARGDARRQCVVVPKSVASNWQKEAGRIWPDAKVLVIGETVTKKGKTRADTAAEREAKLAMAAQGDYDLVIMTKPAFERVRIREETKSRFSDEEFYAQRKAALEGKGAKAREKARQQAIDQAAAAEYADHDESTYWEELRFDSLYVDEAHAYKNLYKAKQRFGQSVKFLGGGGQSKQAMDAMHKARVVRERNGGDGVFYLTATPMKNSPLEIYNMTQHIIPEVWAARGIRNTEDFIDRYCVIEQRMVANSALELVEAPCVTGFKNLGELRAIWDEYVDQRTAVDVDLTIPSVAPSTHLIDMDATQRSLYEGFRAEVEALDSGGATEPGEIFRIFEKMRKVAMDPELLDPVGNADYPSPKLQAVVDNIVKQIKDGGGGQIVFCDYIATHDKLREMLIAAGLKPEEIGIINAKKVKDSGKLLEIGERFREGRIKVVIGNTAKMGEGVNLQDRTTDIHHVDQPWDPGSMQQREGRGVRRGNQNETVRVHTYLARGSFDAIRYGTLEGKRLWLDRFLGGAESVENGAFGSDEDGSMAANLDRETTLAMLNPDPEAALEQLKERRAEQAAAYADKKAAEAVKEFERLQKYLSSMGGLKEGSKARVKLQAKVEGLRAKLRRNKHLSEPLRAAMDTGVAAVVEPETGLVVHEGQSLIFAGRDAPMYWSSDETAFVVESVDSTKGTVRVRRVGSAEVSRPIAIARFAKGVKDGGAHDPSAEDAAAMAAAEKDIGFYGSKAWREAPPEVVARNADDIKGKLRDFLRSKYKKAGSGVGKVLVLSEDGTIEARRPPRPAQGGEGAEYMAGLKAGQESGEILLPQVDADWDRIVAAGVAWEESFRASEPYQRALRPADPAAGRTAPTLRYLPSGTYKSPPEALEGSFGEEWKRKLEQAVTDKLGARPRVDEQKRRRW